MVLLLAGLLLPGRRLGWGGMQTCKEGLQGPRTDVDGAGQGCLLTLSPGASYFSFPTLRF